MSNTTSPTVIVPIEVLYGCFTVGTSSNIFAFRYFILKEKDVSTIIYICITVVDVIISFLTLPVGLSYLNNRNPTLFVNTVFCEIWGYMWNIVQQVSVFLVSLLSITRTVRVVFPFHKITRELVIGIIIVYAFLQLINILVMLFWYNIRLSYDFGYADCTQHNEVSSKVYTATQIMSLVIPVFLVTISAAISIGWLQAPTLTRQR